MKSKISVSIIALMITLASCENFCPQPTKVVEPEKVDTSKTISTVLPPSNDTTNHK